jgi:signal peptidase I
MFFKPAYIKDAQERRRLLKKVYLYRRSQLTRGEVDAINAMSEKLKKAIQSKNKKALETLDRESGTLLKKVGAHYYRNYYFFDNVETFVVAAIVAIGIRSFFLQPFQIPTNSMWPTYHGMVYEFKKDSPGEGGALAGLRRVWEFIVHGATRHYLKAPCDGEFKIAIFGQEEREQYHSIFRYRDATQDILGLIPSKVHEYLFKVGDTPVTLALSADFSMDRLLIDKFFSDKRPLIVDSDGYASTGVQVRAGEPLLNFDIASGDMLFVDRFTYNFFPPKIGDPIVFRTRAIPGITQLNSGIPDDKYYIKRLVGLPGDKLSIKDTILYRNGAPITGTPIFEKNFKKTPPYPGYQAAYNLANGNTAIVPSGNFYGFGDNSPDSEDSRVWGGIPQDQLVGRAVFIYYPFTERWGLSK